jgi:hypothetical protein
MVGSVGFVVGGWWGAKTNYVFQNQDTVPLMFKKVSLVSPKSDRHLRAIMNKIQPKRRPRS